MKNRIESVILLFVAIIAISSCTMEKRHYQSGYYIDWGKNDASKSTAVNNAPITKAQKIAAVKLPESSNEVYSVRESVSDLSASSDNALVPAKKLSPSASEKNVVVTAPKKISKYQAFKAMKKAVKAHKNGDSDFPEILMILLCIFLPPIAVGIMTDWEFEPLAINILLCLLCWLPGIIHAFIIYDRGR